MTDQSQPLPVPPEFSFEWDSPEEAASFWIADLMHWPNGISLLAATMDMEPFGRGLNKAGEQLCMPFSRMQFKLIRGYVYTSIVPYSTDPARMEARMAQMQGKMMEHVPGLLDRDLAALLETLRAKREREGELHFLAVFPAGAAVMGYEEVYTQLFGEPKAGEHLQLLQGFENKSVEANNALWRLAMEARRRPKVLGIIRGVAPSGVPAAPAASEEGRALRGAG